MMVVVPCSANHVPFTSGITFSTSRNTCLARYSYSGQSAKQSSTSHSFFATPPRTTITFPQLKYACASHNLSRIQRISATAVDVAAEKQDLHFTDEATSQPSVEHEVSTNSISVPHTQAKQRQGRKSVMPPVKDEELVPGAIFTGKVITIHPFGAFVDIGAFKDGLVHVSQLSDKFVKDVNNVVSVGQEVKVRLLKVDSDTGRIYLSMRNSDDNNKPKSATREGQKRKEIKKTLKFVKGQEVVGKVKKFGRSGAFISLLDGEEGFLPNSEEADEGFGTVMGNSLLEVGQEVKVRVLQVNRGSLTLTMKKKENAKKFESELEEGVVHKATNPFIIAFRRNKDIAAFLDERERMKSLEDVEETMEHDDP